MTSPARIRGRGEVGDPDIAVEVELVELRETGERGQVGDRGVRDADGEQPGQAGERGQVGDVGVLEVSGRRGGRHLAYVTPGGPSLPFIDDADTGERVFAWLHNWTTSFAWAPDGSRLALRNGDYQAGGISIVDALPATVVLLWGTKRSEVYVIEVATGTSSA